MRSDKNSCFIESGKPAVEIYFEVQKFKSSKVQKFKSILV